MCRVRSVELDPDTQAVAAARRSSVALLGRWDLAPLRADTELLVSELVTNAVLHGRSRITLTLAVADGILEVGVSDRSPMERGLPSSPPPQPWLAEGGRGLHLVDQVADEWGVATMPEGKQVWFRLDVGESWPHRTACPCGGEDLGRVRLESGRFAVAAPGPWDTDAG